VEYTNLAQLPKSLFWMLTFNEYKEADGISVTTLIDSPRVRVLKKKYQDRLRRDATDNVYMFLGTAVHRMLQTYPKGIKEKRFTAQCGGIDVYGTPDLIEDQTITDYKASSAWINTFGPRPEWEPQLNVYRWIVRENDIVVNDLRSVVIFRDWSRNMDRDGYPAYPVGVYEIPVWTLKETKAYIENRVAAHLSAEKTLPLCTEQERWQQDGVYAVHLKGQKRAKRLLDTLEEAYSWVGTNSGIVADTPLIAQGDEMPKQGYCVVKRPNKWKRCHDYCDVSEWCDQYQNFSKPPVAADSF